MPEMNENLKHLQKKAINLIKKYKNKRLIGMFSGGKDSIVIKELVRISKVNCEWHYSKTTIDPPELVRFIRKHHSDVQFKRPKKGNYFNRLVEKGIFPSFFIRWCCDEYKEIRIKDKNAIKILGIRAEESPKRAKQWSEDCIHKRTGEHTINPIFQWSSEDLWNFIKTKKLKYPSLYEEGFHRLGCVGCPLGGKIGMKRDFERWPKIAKKWEDSAYKIYEKKYGTKTKTGKDWIGNRFDSPLEYWLWIQNGQKNTPKKA